MYVYFFLDLFPIQNPFSCHNQIILIRGFNYPAHRIFPSLPILCRCAGFTLYL